MEPHLEKFFENFPPEPANSVAFLLTQENFEFQLFITNSTLNNHFDPNRKNVSIIPVRTRQGVKVIYHRCPNCGQIYYSAATLKGDQLICDRCGAIIVPITSEQLKKFIEEEKSKSKKSEDAS
ncbi:hypothetical protein AS159_05215 [Thermotoga sp. Ku-13t]|nr:hypothetical protein AS159_05215 [Thermotoga sp. Ku-13t]